MWILFVALYIIFSITYNQFYKVTTKKCKSEGALTALLQIIAGLTALITLPFFKFNFPTTLSVWLLLLLACIFYALSDRMNTTVRSGLEASTFGIILQVSTVFMTLAGLFFFKEPFVLKKMIGAIMIILSNVLVFYQKGKGKINKYVIMGIFSNLAYAFALFLDVNISDSFNLAIYVAITLIVPAVFIIIGERIKFKDIINEYKIGDKAPIFITSIGWGLMIIFQLMAFKLGDVTTISPLLSLTVIGNVIIGYLFLNEKDNLPKKIIAAIMIIISILLIKG
ncbi:MAG: EamA family transporter [Bacilli bacterium]|nr:EamA family transporter [Bacilli bacterium]